jgi:hypothetical protein
MRTRALRRAKLPGGARAQVLDSFWKINVIDIESTLKAATAAVLEEPSVPAAALRARTKGLKKLGAIMQARDPGSPAPLVCTLLTQ